MDLWAIRKTYQKSYTVCGLGYSQKYPSNDEEYIPFNYEEEKAGET